jgi:hypothetical protein
VKKEREKEKGGRQAGRKPVRKDGDRFKTGRSLKERRK